jgi:uncharacterized glyoxalase superfamily protein PhnB
MSVHELFAYLCVKDADAAIQFYVKAFGATEKFRLTEPNGRIGLFGEGFESKEAAFVVPTVAFPKSDATRHHGSPVARAVCTRVLQKL